MMDHLPQHDLPPAAEPTPAQLGEMMARAAREEPGETLPFDPSSPQEALAEIGAIDVEDYFIGHALAGLASGFASSLAVLPQEKREQLDVRIGSVAKLAVALGRATMQAREEG